MGVKIELVNIVLHTTVKKIIKVCRQRTQYIRCKIIVTFLAGLITGVVFITVVSLVERWLTVCWGIVKVIWPVVDELVVVANNLLLAPDIAAGEGDWNRSLRLIGDCRSLKEIKYKSN